ncbi:MAG: T9SS type A sorting domain-containing protein [Bacteroidetes bacterium]|nr:T9SS type A sorting domain-containing protein [Bacteroidota bacterium]
MSTNTYEVNNNPVDFYWDFNRNMAISNCSNYGNDILSAWYNGKDIVYKHSTPDVMSFRAAPNNITAPEQVGTLIAPNPANSFLKISGIPSGTKYLITDISGRTVLQGQLSAEQKIDTQSLTDGKYFIRILGGGKFMKNYSFTKK